MFEIFLTSLNLKFDKEKEKIYDENNNIVGFLKENDLFWKTYELKNINKEIKFFENEQNNAKFQKKESLTIPLSNEISLCLDYNMVNATIDFSILISSANYFSLSFGLSKENKINELVLKYKEDGFTNHELHTSLTKDTYNYRNEVFCGLAEKPFWQFENMFQVKKEGDYNYIKIGKNEVERNFLKQNISFRYNTKPYYNLNAIKENYFDIVKNHMGIINTYFEFRFFLNNLFPYFDLVQTYIDILGYENKEFEDLFSINLLNELNKYPINNAEDFKVMQNNFQFSEEIKKFINKKGEKKWNF
jgi:hypothetical protein